MKLKKAESITIMFPFLNDWGTVGSLIALAVETVKKYTGNWEVVIVNDGSMQSNREALEMIVKLLNENGRRIKIVTHEKNRGYGGALRSGFTAATKDLIFYTDCDAQYDPRELTKLLDKMTAETGLVNGYKIKRSDPLHRVIAGRVYHYLVAAAFAIPVRDTDCDFRLIRREVFKKVRLFENTGTICVELVGKINHFGYKISEVPVHHFWRTSGKSQFFNFRRLSATAGNLFKLWWKLRVKKDFQT